MHTPFLKSAVFLAAVSSLAMSSAAMGEIIHIDDIVLDGFQPVPPTGSLASGLASVIIDTETRDISVTGSFSGLEGDVLFGHLHGPAVPGQSSNLVIFALQIQGDFMHEGTFTATQRVSPFQLNVILDSRSYLNIHSTAYPTGEIRGQVVVPTPGGLGLLAVGGLIATRRKR
ncbi:MAG: CHRD domain-containing protein [Phycisphaerales bacterium]